MSTPAQSLLLHPIRLRLIQALTARSLSAAQLQDALQDIPQSSLYRHLSILRKAGYVQVDPEIQNADPREKSYRLAKPTRLRHGQVQGLSLAEHKRMFTTWGATLMQRFTDYLSDAAAQGPIDLEADRVGYTERVFYADEAEFDAIAAQLEGVMASAAERPAGPGRRRRRLCTVTFPEKS